MTPHAKGRGASRPNIYIGEADYALLSALVGSARGGQPGAGLLRDELDRAVVVRAGEMPSGFATLGSFVRYEDRSTGKERTVQLVLPVAADIEKNRVSVFTPIGAALLGVGARREVSLALADGAPRRLQILEVASPADAVRS